MKKRWKRDEKEMKTDDEGRKMAKKDWNQKMKGENSRKTSRKQGKKIEKKEKCYHFEKKFKKKLAV